MPITTLAAHAGSKQGFGLSNFTTSSKGYLLHGHDGSTFGGRSHYLYQSKLNRGIIVLANSDSPGFSRLKEAVLKAVMQPVPQQLPLEYPLTKAQKKDWTGYYRPNAFRLAITGWFLAFTDLVHINEEEGILMLHDGLASEPMRLRPVAPNRALWLDKRGYTPELTLVHNDTGEWVLVRPFGPGLSANTATKSSVLAAWLPLIVGYVAVLLLLINLLMGLGWLVRWAWLKRKGRRLSAVPVRVSLVIYAFSYLLMVLGSDASMLKLGVVSPLTITIFVASVLAPLAALGALISLIRNYSQIPSRADRLFLGVAVGSALVVVGYMAVWGLVGARPWV